MRTIILTLCILSSFIWQTKAEETVEYHFQKGFTSKSGTKIDDWTINCGSTNTSTLLRNELYKGTYIPRFDGGHDETNTLISPEFTGAGTLTFWICTSSANTTRTVYVGTIIDGTTTTVKEIPYSQIAKTWQEIKVPLNLDNSTKLKLVFWSTETTNNGARTMLDDIALTKYSGPAIDPIALDRIETNFGDGTWGTPLTAGNLPTSGSYPTAEFNGFKLANAVLYANKPAYPDGTGTYTNTVAVDKKTAGGVIEFPETKTVGEIEVHAMSGSEGMGYFLQEYNGSAWVNIGEQVVTQKTISITTFPLERTAISQFRIANATGSGLFVAKIIVRSLAETKELNVITSSPEEGSTCYYNLTKNITLTFNKEITAGTGNLLLNGENIPVSNGTIDEKTFTLPVSLASTTSGKTYTLSVPKGVFVEKADPTNQNNAKEIVFQTYKTVSYPVGYRSQIDIVYSDANPAQNRMDVYYPESPEKPVPIVLNIHGGGWASGEKESQGGFNIYFDKGFAVANVEYRMTAHATAPAAVVDVRCALMYLLNHASELNIDPQRIIFQGGSAGGHLALTAGYLQNNRNFDTNCNYTGSFKVIAVIDKYGPSDLTRFLHYGPLQRWLGDYYSNSDTDFQKSISPLYLIHASTTPPTYIIHGDADPTVNYEQSEFLAEALQQAGIKYQFTTVPGGVHGNFTSEYNTRMNNEITAFLTEVLEKSNTDCRKILTAPFTPVVSGNTITIPAEGNTQIFIYDICGKLLRSTEEKSFEITQNGILIVKVLTEEGTFNFKIR